MFSESEYIHRAYGFSLSQSVVKDGPTDSTQSNPMAKFINASLDKAYRVELARYMRGWGGVGVRARGWGNPWKNIGKT